MIKGRIIVLLVLCSLSLLRASEIVSTTIYAGWDAIVDSENPAVNYGDNTHIAWSYASASPLKCKKGYFRFKLPDEAAGNISAAKLKLIRSGVGPWYTSPKLYILDDDASGQDWDEFSITWSNAPANTTTGTGFSSTDATLIYSESIPGTNGGGTVGDIWEVTDNDGSPDIIDQLNNDTDTWVTFMVEWGTATYATGEYFAAREHTTIEGPVLELTYTASEYKDVKTLASERWHQWRQNRDKFPSASWQALYLYTATASDYETYADAELNMVQSPYDDYDYADSANLDILMGSWENLWRDYAKLSNYINYPTSTTQDVIGYILFDEPDSDYFDEIATATEYIYRYDQRDAIPIVDHLPNWAVEYNRFGLGDGDGTYYKTYINKYVNDVSPCVMINCHYPILSDGSDRPEYYDNIEYFRELAIDNNIGLMGFALANAHSGYREPSESDMNWMVYSYIAYGAKGIFYYNYRINPINGFEEGLVSHASGTPRTTYYMAQDINKELDNIWSVFKELRSTSVFHTGTSVPTGTTQYSDGMSNVIESFTGNDFIIGEFNNIDDPNDRNLYAVIVNKSHGASSDCDDLTSTVTFSAYQSYPSVSVIDPATGYEEFLTPTAGVYSLSIDGGKGLLLRFSQLESAVITPDIDTYIYAANPNTDYSSSTGIVAQNSTQFTDRNRKIYLKFLLPTDIDTAENVTLEITPSSIYNENWSWDYEVYGLKDSTGDDDWSAITWNNAPANNTANGTGFDSDATGCLAEFIGGGFAGTIRFIESQDLIDFVNDDTDGIVTLMIVRSSDSSANDVWTSDETTTYDPPTLIVKYNTGTATTTIIADADAYVYSTSPTTNYGTSDTLYMLTQERISKSYLRFELPTDCNEIVDSEFTMIRSYVGPWWRGTGLYGLSDSVTGQQWSETAITWNNAPANLESGNDFTTDATDMLAYKWLPGYNASGAAGDSVTWADDDLTSFLDTDTDSDVTLMLKWESELGSYYIPEAYASKENTTYDSPELYIEYHQPDKTTTIETTKDAYIWKAYPDSSFETSTSLIAQNSTSFTDRNRKIYVKFSLPTDVDTVVSAQFEMVPSSIYNSNYYWKYNIHGLDDSADEDSWSSITWNNAPANDTTNGTGFDSDATDALCQISTGGITAGTTVSISDADLVTFLNEDTDNTVTLMLARVENSSANDLWASDENTTYNPPKLTITYKPTSTTTTIYPEADAEVCSLYPGSNYGSFDEMELLYGDGSRDNRTLSSYIRFELPIDFKSVKSAKLNLVRSSVGPWWQGLSLYGLNDSETGQDWSETTITWNNAPANDTNTTSFISSKSKWLSYNWLPGYNSSAAAGDIATWQSSSFDISKSFEVFVNTDTDGIITFMLNWDEYNDTYSVPEGFASKEHATYDAPELEIEYYKE